MSVLVRGKAILSMKNNGLGIIDKGTIYVENGKIQGIGPDEEVLKIGNKSDYYIDVRDTGLIMPGLIDAHMHTHLAIIRGFCQDVPEIEWMMKTVSPFTKLFEERYTIAGSLLSVLEALKSGTTTFGDYGSNMKRTLKKIYEKYGLRAIITNTINSISTSLDNISENDLYPFDIEKGYKQFEYTKKLFEQYDNKPNVFIMLGPQALDMLPLSLLKEIVEFALENNTMVHMHVAQGERERRQVYKRYGESTVKILEKEKIVGPHLLAAHCHDANDEELKILADNDVRMVSCQRSISMIDGVIPPLAKYIALGGKAALGTDQASGNNNQSLFSELKMVSILGKVLMKNPTILPAWKVLRLATIEGAMALGLDKYIGSLERSKQGDFIIINLKKHNLRPVLSYPIRNYVFNLVYSSYGNEITHVFINGEPKVMDGKVIIIKEEEVTERAQKMAEELSEKAGEEYNNTNNYLVKMHREGYF